MFSSKAKQSAPAPQTPQPGPARGNPRGTAAPSIISADLVVNGTLCSSGDIQIDGRVEGDVRGVCLVIGEKAEIHGEVQAEEITVRGKVTGRINARKILLASTSHVEGDILHEAIAVESGAFFEGSCRHSDNPAADKAQDMASPGKAGAAPPAILAGTLRALGQAG
jgi:cytoskeletal protein CcmA (bactofilin family)